MRLAKGFPVVEFFSSEKRPPRIPQQVSRLAIVFALLIAALVAARHYLIPPTFGDDGHYRAAAIKDITAHPIKYAGRDACADCHSEEVETQSHGRHQALSCETCHGPAAAHVADPGAATPIIPRSRDFCPRCHGYDSSRPTGFPQIDPVSHNPPTPCVECHKPHAPQPPTVPSTCTACHAEIEHTKVASPHAGLPCTRCHEVSEQHRDTPRLSTPTKPTTREFCGGCHAKDANSPKEIPRIDLATHGGRTLCWQCHYPHFPEVRS
jgi:hypothetical protein